MMNVSCWPTATPLRLLQPLSLLSPPLIDNDFWHQDKLWQVGFTTMVESSNCVDMICIDMCLRQLHCSKATCIQRFDNFGFWIKRSRAQCLAFSSASRFFLSLRLSTASAEMAENGTSYSWLRKDIPSFLIFSYFLHAWEVPCLSSS